MSLNKLFLVSVILALAGSINSVDLDDDEYDEDFLYYTPAPDVEDALEKHLIIPDLLKHGSEFELDVTYGDKSKVKLGSKFTPEQIENKPTFLRWPCRQDAYHTLIFTEYTESIINKLFGMIELGLDVPSQKTSIEREWRHWIVVNIPANNITQGETIVPYQGPGYSYENGLHRLVFMVYEQPWRHPISFLEGTSKESPVRPKFDSKKFSDKYDLGDPVAVNFLICETNRPKPTRTI